MMRFYFSVLSLLLPLFGCAQILGHVSGKSNGKPLSGATVLFLKGDSVLIKTFAGANGSFSVALFPPGHYKLSVSYLGYSTAVSQFEISPKVVKVDLKTIELEPSTTQLSGVEVKIRKPLIKIRKDTLEFSASDYHTAENASLKNLLEKLPGFYIDPNGDIFFDGKPLQEIYIEGRPVKVSSLTGMGKMSAIAQLLASAADKIQIMAAKPSLTGFPSAGKILNITIAKKMRKGINGAIGAGYGTPERYSLGGNANLFRDDKQMMLSGLTNNVSSMRTPWSTDEAEYLNEQLPGIIKPVHLTGSLSADLSKSTRISASVFHQAGEITNNQFSNRSNILKDSIFEYDTRALRNTHFTGDNFITSAEFTLGELNSLSVGINGMLVDQNISGSTSFSTLGSRGDTINFGQSSNTSTQRTSSLNMNASFRHKTKSGKAFGEISLDMGQNKTSSNQDNFTLNHMPLVPSDTIHQLVSCGVLENRLNVMTSVSYILVKGVSVNLNYNLTTVKTTNPQHTLDYHGNEADHFQINPGLSYDFKNTGTVHAITGAISFFKEKMEGGLNLSFNQNNSFSDLRSSAVTFRQKIHYWAPAIYFGYHFSPEQTLNVRLSSLPGYLDRARSLLPVISVENPLYIQLGNPDLKPSVDRKLNVDFSLRKPSGLSCLFNFIATATENALSSAINTDSSGKQVSKQINVKGTYDLLSIIDLSKRFDAQQLTVKYNNLNALRRSSSLINGLENATRSYRTDHRLSISWMYKTFAEVSLTTSFQYLGNAYGLDNSYRDFTLFKNYFSLNFFLPWGFSLGGATVHTKNSSLSQQYTLVNAWLSKTCLPKKSLLIKVYSYDLTAQNKSLQSMVTPTFTENTQNSVLERYFLLSATYFFGKK